MFLSLPHIRRQLVHAPQRWGSFFAILLFAQMMSTGITPVLQASPGESSLQKALRAICVVNSDTSGRAFDQSGVAADCIVCGCCMGGKGEHCLLRLAVFLIVGMGLVSFVWQQPIRGLVWQQAAPRGPPVCLR
ncbi:MAG: hypothetical protein CMF31_00625 [Kordiimonas sp.]|nr:hypothetical protein [Kordiimonas sp.]